MTGLINLITDHSSKLNILPIVVLMNIVIVILIHLLTKRKFIKYIPSLFLGFGALFVLYTAFQDFTTKRGLDLAWIAIFIGSAALVGIFTCIILDLISSIRKNTRTMEASTPRAQKKSRSKKKIREVGEVREVGTIKEKTPSKVRVAKKPTRSSIKDENPSKYYTSKISSDTKKVKASRIDNYEIEKMTFESDSEN